MNFGCSRKERVSVSTHIDQDFTKKNLGLVKVQKNYPKFFFKLLTDIKLKIFQRSSISTLRYNPMGDKGIVLCLQK